jgi:hypothetical protein
MAVVKGDYNAEKIYKDSATCKAEGAVANTWLNTINPGCISGGSAYFKYFCTGSKLQYQQYTSSTCATTSGQIQDASFSSISCDKSNSTISCSAGNFTSPPAGTIYAQVFTTNQCDVPAGSGYISQFGIMASDKSCIPDYSTWTSVRTSCSAGTSNFESYAGVTCSGSTTAVATAKSGVCTQVLIGGTVSNIRAMCTAAASGASSTSVTILAVVLLVLATFSSTM